MKERLKKLLARVMSRMAELDTLERGETITVAELRSINTERRDLMEQRAELQASIDEIEAQERAANPTADQGAQSAHGAQQTATPAAGEQRGAAPQGQLRPMGTYGMAQHQQARQQEQDADDPFNTLEYRRAFMRYVQTGEAGEALQAGFRRENRADAFTSTTDIGAMIPTTIVNEVIKEMKVHGLLYSRVRKSNIPGGVQVPILSLKPTATRITESTPSDRKKVQANTFVSFNYYGLECKIAQSLLASIVTLPEFEQQIVPIIVDAMITQCEIEIVKGTGVGEMLGVTVDTRVVAGQVITLSSAEFASWPDWKKKVFAKIPLAYRAGGLFLMASGTFEGYIDGMVDANGQPIGRVNYGITNGPQERFGGKEVLLVEEDVVLSYDAAAVGDVVAIFMNPQDYDINSNMQMTMYRWFDHDNNQWVDKAILINDGKLLDAMGVLIIKKGA